LFMFHFLSAANEMNVLVNCLSSNRKKSIPSLDKRTV